MRDASSVRDSEEANVIFFCYEVNVYRGSSIRTSFLKQISDSTPKLFAWEQGVADTWGILYYSFIKLNKPAFREYLKTVTQIIFYI